MSLAFPPSIGPTELILLCLTALFWIAIAMMIVSAIRFFRQRTDQDRTIATLVEENRRLREALGEKPDGPGTDSPPAPLVS